MYTKMMARGCEAGLEADGGAGVGVCEGSFKVGASATTDPTSLPHDDRTSAHTNEPTMFFLICRPFSLAVTTTCRHARIYLVCN
jgi:hypothetical protein